MVGVQALGKRACCAGCCHVGWQRRRCVRTFWHLTRHKRKMAARERFIYYCDARVWRNLMARPHILVVDDDARLRELLRRYLQEQQFFVTTAPDAAAARASLATIVPD